MSKRVTRFWDMFVTRWLFCPSQVPTCTDVMWHGIDLRSCNLILGFVCNTLALFPLPDSMRKFFFLYICIIDHMHRLCAYTRIVHKFIVPVIMIMIYTHDMSMQSISSACIRTCNRNKKVIIILKYEYTYVYVHTIAKRNTF